MPLLSPHLIYLYFYFQSKKKAEKVQRPEPLGSVPDGLRKNKTNRPPVVLQEGDEEMTWRRLNFYMRNAQKIRLPVTLAELQKPLSPKKQADLERICTEELGDQQPARATSAQYLDRNGEPIFFYLGHRVITDEPPVLHSFFSAESPRP